MLRLLPSSLLLAAALAPTALAQRPNVEACSIRAPGAESTGYRANALTALGRACGVHRGTAAPAQARRPGEAVAEALRQRWDGSQWVDLDRTRYTYPDTTTGEIITTEETLSESGWVGTARTLDYYTGLDLARSVEQAPDTVGWVNERQRLLTYADGKLAVAVTEEWLGTAWFATSRLTYTYAGDGLREVLSEVAAPGGPFVNRFRSVYTYDGGVLVSVEDQEWKDETWAPIFRSLYTIEAGNEIEFVSQQWKDGAWANLLRTTRLFVGDQVDRETHEFWTGSAWQNNTRVYYSYEGDNVTVRRNQSWSGTSWFNTTRTLSEYAGGLLTERRIQRAAGSDWVDDFRTAYAYTFVDAEAGPLARARALDLFPNPGSARVTARFEASGAYQLTVVDLLGRAVARRSGHAGGQTDAALRLDRLPPGRYFVRLTTAHGVQTAPLSVVR